jgi:hypothetical protein
MHLQRNQGARELPRQLPARSRSWRVSSLRPLWKMTAPSWWRLLPEGTNRAPVPSECGLALACSRRFLPSSSSAVLRLFPRIMQSPSHAHFTVCVGRGMLALGCTATAQPLLAVTLLEMCSLPAVQSSSFCSTLAYVAPPLGTISSRCSLHPPQPASPPVLSLHM